LAHFGVAANAHYFRHANSPPPKRSGEHMVHRPPNVIYVYADDLGRGMLSCYGQELIQTPNIHRIPAEGIRFTNFYGCILCPPARASLLLGPHDCHRGTCTYTSGGIYNRVASGAITVDQIAELIHTSSLLPQPGDLFLPHVARAAGCATAEIGKLEWGFATTAREIQSHGWEYHYGYYDHARCHGYYPPWLFENGSVVGIPGNARDDCGVNPEFESPQNAERRWDLTGRAVYSQDLFDQKILEFIRANRDRPFVLYHPSQLPHGPIAIPAVHPSVAANSRLTQYEKEYASMVLRLDQTVGMILDELQRLGIDDNTVVVFTSDNGHECYYRQEGRCDPTLNIRTGEPYDNVTTRMYSELSGDVFNGNDGMAGKKWTPWEGGPRIPAMIRWPGTIEPGRVSDRLIASYDFMPTLADILGTAQPPGKDGVSFAGELRGWPDPGPDHEYILYATDLGPAIVNRDGWKLRFVRQPRENHYQLYHLASDYREERNLIAEGPEHTVNRLSTVMLRECGGNFSNGMADAHHVWFPGWEFFGRDCDWRMRW